MHENDILRVVRECIPKMMVTTPSPVDAVSGDEWNGSHDIPIDVVVHDASDLHIQTLCSLWAGMGHIYKVQIPWTSKKSGTGTSSKRPHQNVSTRPNNNNNDTMTLIIKHIVLPRTSSKQSLSNQRKTDSYYVEANLYERLVPMLLSKYKISVPVPYLIERPRSNADGEVTLNTNEIIIAMSYVENDRSKRYSTRQQRDAVLTWLASFHAIFWGSEKADDAVYTYGLQPEGSYWYLNTRPEEHDEMPSTGWIGRLKTAARAIADYLQHRDIYQCIIHGDAKEANILYTCTNFTGSGNVGTCCKATFCDFQYCGKGSLTKDLVYYLMRFDDKNDDNMDDAVEFYLQQLTKQLPPHVTAPSLQDLQTSLSLAYCDLYRFMIGWGNGGSNNRPNRRVIHLLNQLDNGVHLNSEEAYDAALRRAFG